MSRRLPLLRKTPFVLDPRPLAEATSAHAGLLCVSRAYRSLGLPGMIEANLPLRKRRSGFTEAQINLAGRMNRNDCVMGLRLCADGKAIKRMQRVWEVFALPTQATSAQPRGGRGR
jgi:hypothetical protein